MRKPLASRRRTSTCSESYSVNARLCVRLAPLTSGFITQKLAGSPASSMFDRNVAFDCSDDAAWVIGVPGRICPSWLICAEFVQLVPVYCAGSFDSDLFFPVKLAR